MQNAQVQQIIIQTINTLAQVASQMPQFNTVNLQSAIEHLNVVNSELHYPMGNSPESMAYASRQPVKSDQAVDLLLSLIDTMDPFYAEPAKAIVKELHGKVQQAEQVVRKVNELGAGMDLRVKVPTSLPIDEGNEI